MKICGHWQFKCHVFGEVIGSNCQKKARYQIQSCKRKTNIFVYCPLVISQKCEDDGFFCELEPGHPMGWLISKMCLFYKWVYLIESTIYNIVM